MNAIIDALLALGGGFFAILSVAFGFIAVRTATSGSSAYQANRVISSSSMSAALRGDMRMSDLDTGSERRIANGMAVDLKTGALIRQQRLSSESIDEVIGRKA